jgi:GIY-YIG catalytic domain-containing protein/NUMOD1 domain-containing protein
MKNNFTNSNFLTTSLLVLFSSHLLIFLYENPIIIFICLSYLENLIPIISILTSIDKDYIIYIFISLINLIEQLFNILIKFYQFWVIIGLNAWVKKTLGQSLFTLIFYPPQITINPINYKELRRDTRRARKYLKRRGYSTQADNPQNYTISAQELLNLLLDINIKPHHLEAIISILLKDRIDAITKINPALIIATLGNLSNSHERNRFFSDLQSNTGIYMIQYKSCPYIYYIGRSTNLKHRLIQHIYADTNDKFHLFASTLGWDQFSYSILELSSPELLIDRERYWLQTYFPILNSCYNSSSAQYRESRRLYTILEDLRLNLNLPIPKKKGIKVWCYIYFNNSIQKEPLIFESVSLASKDINIGKSILTRYLNTNMVISRYINKILVKQWLVYSEPIKDFELTLAEVLKNIEQYPSRNNQNRNVWVYLLNHDLNTVTPKFFISRLQAIKYLNIHHETLNRYILKTQAAIDANGIRLYYAFDRQLESQEIQNIFNLPLNRKICVPIFVYEIGSLSLVNGLPFDSIVAAAQFVNSTEGIVFPYLDKNVPFKGYLFRRNKLSS